MFIKDKKRDKQRCMNCSPDDKGPVGSMPEAGDQKDDKNIADGFGFGHPTSTQRDIDVIPKPSGKGNVPSAPELSNISREIGSPKIGHEVKAKKFGCTDGDIRIAGKVSINLKGKEYSSHH